MLLNKKACRTFLLDYAQRRAHKFTRVSDTEVYPYLEHRLRDIMRTLVEQQPSMGKTIKLP